MRFYCQHTAALNDTDIMICKVFIDFLTKIELKRCLPQQSEGKKTKAMY